MSAPIYATLTDYRNWVGDTDAEIPAVLLARASEVIDEVLIGALYTVDPTTQLPTDTDVIAAIRDATCAQAQYMSATGDTTGTGTTTSWGNVKIGSVSLSEKREAPSVTSATGVKVALTALRPLRIAGLLDQSPLVLG